LSRYRYLWLVGGLILLGTTIILGRNPAGFGPRLWLGVFDAYFQPSELLKLLLIVFLASYLAENRELLADERASTISRLRYLLPLLMMWGISLIVLVWQRDLGTATLFFIIFLGMLYIATGQAGYVVGGAILLLLAGGVAYFAFDVVKLRVDVWLNPWPEANDRAFQIVQSLLAFASGGVFGQGIGQGSPTYIPVVHSDFIFAAIGEEWGLLGTLCVVACIAVFSVRAFRLAARLESRPFRGLLAAGIGITLATQSLMIIGGTIKLIPLTGVTLPFLSYGGSSLLVNFIMVGLLLILSNDR
jgi:cell division protein FtsW (lipid II flippase)